MAAIANSVTKTPGDEKDCGWVGAAGGWMDGLRLGWGRSCVG
jgi:hypothetical protein